MGLLDGLIGGVVGAEMISVVNGVIEKHGGLQGVVSQFQQQGMGNTIKSWIGTGANEPISPDQVHHVLGTETVNELAAKYGMTAEELSAKLSTALPPVIDKMTPAGMVPGGK